MDAVRCPKLDGDRGREPTQQAAQPTAVPTGFAIGPDGMIASTDGSSAPSSGDGAHEQIYGGWGNPLS